MARETQVKIVDNELVVGSVTVGPTDTANPERGRRCRPDLFASGRRLPRHRTVGLAGPRRCGRDLPT